MPTTPQTVYLLGCPAEVEAPGGGFAPVSLIGLFDIEEYMPYEPSNYVWSPTYLVAPHDPLVYDTLQRWMDEPVVFAVDAANFDEQVRPKMCGRMLVLDREMEAAAERDWT